MYVINGEGDLVYKGGIDDQPTARLQDLKSAIGSTAGFS
jgi:hypothetical protein